MARLDPQITAHLEWLGFVRPTGLVVSAPALVKAGALLNRCDSEGQQLLRGCVEERRPDSADAGAMPEPRLPNFRDFASSVLGWNFSPAGYAGTDEAPIPDELEAVLPESCEVLRPDFAVRAEPVKRGATARRSPAVREDAAGYGPTTSRTAGDDPIADDRPATDDSPTAGDRSTAGDHPAAGNHPTASRSTTAPERNNAAHEGKRCEWVVDQFEKSDLSNQRVASRSDPLPGRLPGGCRPRHTAGADHRLPRNLATPDSVLFPIEFADGSVPAVTVPAHQGLGECHGT